MITIGDRTPAPETESEDDAPLENAVVALEELVQILGRAKFSPVVQIPKSVAPSVTVNAPPAQPVAWRFTVTARDSAGRIAELEARPHP